jgi:hypothetical protein
MLFLQRLIFTSVTLLHGADFNQIKKLILIDEKSLKICQDYIIEN